MALNEQLDSLYGFTTIPSGSYDDSASPNSDNEDGFDALAMSTNSVNEQGEGEGVKRKSRRPPSTAERRATHNAVERARRESLNGRFMELASALPSMASVKRPSKSVIVAKSLEYVYQTEDRERALREENANLRKEVEELRAKLGLAPSAAATSPVAIVPSQSPRVGTDRERFGSFDDSASSMLSCSPTSSGSAFDASPLSTVQALAAGNPAYTAAFARAMLPTNTDLIQPPTSTSDATSATTANILNQSTGPSPVSAMPFHLGLPAAVHPLAAYDSNYLMAFSMQQQHQQAVHQQNALNLAMSNNWAGYNFGMHGLNHPITSGVPDYASNLVFA